jgi:hypothetical protein
LAALHLAEEAEQLPPDEAVMVVEALEGASQGLVRARAGS